jgi:hypothetical protein
MGEWHSNYDWELLGSSLTSERKEEEGLEVLTQRLVIKESAATPRARGCCRPPQVGEGWPAN